MKQFEAKELIKQYLSNDLSIEEKQLVEQWFAKNLIESSSIPDQLRIMEADDRIWANLNHHIQQVRKGKSIVRLWPRFAAAGVIVVLLSFCGYFFYRHNLETQQLVELKSGGDILPGNNKAILTLADGKKITLSDTEKGLIAQQGGTEINKYDGGGIAYKASETNNQPLLYNTISTPRGGMYKLVLADGTIVVLNAMSSITYPTAFSGKERKVTLAGEAYFTVAHNAQKPFKVVSAHQTVEVLGTQFNVSAYHDEQAIATTLVSGNVKITNARQETVYLKPGQQAQTTADEMTTTTVDLEEAVAWKDGFFHFNNADIPTVMRALSRWYDVTIEYQGSPTKRRFTGDIYRDIPISKALAIISYLKIRFRVEDKKIIVIQPK